MKEVLSQYDFKWTDKDKLPTSWTEGAFLGNGTLGIQIYFTKRKDEYVLHVELGSNDVYDRRPTRDFWMAKQFDNPRLPIGCLEYVCGKEIKDFLIHTSLYNAITRVFVLTEKGLMSCQFYVCAKNNMIVIQQEEKSVNDWEFIPYEAISPRQQYGIDTQNDYRIDPNYSYNDRPVLHQERNLTWAEQSLSNSWKTITLLKYKEDTNSLFIKIQQEKDLSLSKILEQIEKDIACDFLSNHLEYWHNYYSISSLSIPDKTLECFYWRQIYKLGCVVRNESRVIDNQGPWISSTPWPGTWWNLNVQLCYWPLYTSNRLEQAQSLNNFLMQHKQDLIANVPKQYQYDSAGIGTCTTYNLKAKVADPTIDNKEQFVELGNLTWVMHNCFLYYKMSMDLDVLRELIFPLLKRCVNYYVHFIIEGEDGKLHLPATRSPEYGKMSEDSNYELSLLRWGCVTLLECVDILKITDEKEKIWIDICERLVDYPQNETGYMIGKNLAYAKSHRHFSHLMMHVPLYLVNRDNSDSWEFIDKSVKHWFSYDTDIKGFSYVGASLIASAYRQGDIAVEKIKMLLERQITENTMYQEDGPVMETPLAAAECIQQLLLQSWGGKIRVFPAIPSEWESAEFNRFAAQGGFIVSAAYKNNKTVWIEIKSLTNSKCIVETDMKRITVKAQGRASREVLIDKELELYLNQNETIRMEAVL